MYVDACLHVTTSEHGYLLKLIRHTVLYRGYTNSSEENAHLDVTTVNCFATCGLHTRVLQLHIIYTNLKRFINKYESIFIYHNYYFPFDLLISIGTMIDEINESFDSVCYFIFLLILYYMRNAMLNYICYCYRPNIDLNYRPYSYKQLLTAYYIGY